MIITHCDISFGHLPFGCDDMDDSIWGPGKHSLGDSKNDRGAQPIDLLSHKHYFCRQLGFPISGRNRNQSYIVSIVEILRLETIA